MEERPKNRTLIAGFKAPSIDRYANRPGRGKNGIRTHGPDVSRNTGLAVRHLKPTQSFFQKSVVARYDDNQYFFYTWQINKKEGQRIELWSRGIPDHLFSRQGPRPNRTPSKMALQGIEPWTLGSSNRRSTAELKHQKY